MDITASQLVRLIDDSYVLLTAPYQAIDSGAAQASAFWSAAGYNVTSSPDDVMFNREKRLDFFRACASMAIDVMGTYGYFVNYPSRIPMNRSRFLVTSMGERYSIDRRTFPPLANALAVRVRWSTPLTLPSQGVFDPTGVLPPLRMGGQGGAGATSGVRQLSDRMYVLFSVTTVAQFTVPDTTAYAVLIFRGMTRILVEDGNNVTIRAPVAGEVKIGEKVFLPEVPFTVFKGNVISFSNALGGADTVAAIHLEVLHHVSSNELAVCNSEEVETLLSFVAAGPTAIEFIDSFVTVPFGSAVVSRRICDVSVTIIGCLLRLLTALDL